MNANNCTIKKITTFPLFFIAFLLILFAYFNIPLKTYAVADHTVISEIQVGGGTSTDEFVELYNPTDLSVDLTGWKLQKKTASGSEFVDLIVLSGSIPAHGYYLASHTGYDGSIAADITYFEQSVSSNNTIQLINSTDSVVDKVGMGSALDFEGLDTASSPSNNRSIERKAFANSTQTDMVTGGAHEFSGNGEDSDDNDLDLVLRPVSEEVNPQNSASSTEQPIEPSPTSQPFPSPTDGPDPTETPTPNPTIIPSPTPPETKHVVISEIQIGGGTSTDEFVELYNPTDISVDLTDWKLLRKTASGTEFSIVATLSGSIARNGYYLIAHSDYDGDVSSDTTYSEDAISSNNTVQIVNAANEYIDKVGMGSALDFEGLDTASSPANNRSIERKANTDSTSSSMIPGGDDETKGNGHDTDDNDNNFILRPSDAGSDPQNTASTTEDSHEEPTPTEGPSPTINPTNTPVPTLEPTKTPTSTPTPTPGSYRRIVGFFPFSGRVCYLEYRPFGYGRFRFFWPRLKCERV